MRLRAQSFGTAASAIAFVVLAPMRNGAWTDDTGKPKIVPTAVPRSLIGVWARGGRCGKKSLELRVTARTLQFATTLPITFIFVSGKRFVNPDNDYLVPDPKKENTLEFVPLTYNETVRLIFRAGDESDPNHIYFPCFGKPVTWPP